MNGIEGVPYYKRAAWDQMLTGMLVVLLLRTNPILQGVELSALAIKLKFIGDESA